MSSNQQGKRGSERFSNLPKVTPLEGAESGLKSQVYVDPKPVSCHTLVLRESGLLQASLTPKYLR